MIELTYKRNPTQKNWIVEYFPNRHAFVEWLLSNQEYIISFAVREYYE